MIKFTENLAFETKRHRIPVFALHPGLVTEVGMGPNVRLSKRNKAIDRMLAWIDKEKAAGRTRSPEPSAELILLLASGQADKLSGRYLTVDQDITTMINRAETIQKEDFYLLQIKTPA